MNRLAEQEASASSQQPSSSAATTNNTATPTRPPIADGGRVNEHIGPVQFNMGGIQVDADEMVRKLRERGEKKEYGPGTPEGTKKQNEELAQFFAGLMERGKGRGSPRVSSRGDGTPKRGEAGAGGGEAG